MSAGNLGKYILLFTFLTAFTAYAEDSPKTEELYLKALDYIQNSNENAAIAELQNVILLDSRYAAARYQLGLLRLKTGDPMGALTELQQAANLDPKNLDATVKIAEIFLLSRNTEESRKYVERALTADPGYLDALALLANLEMIEGNFATALDHIDKALAKAPESDTFHHIKGRVLVAEGKFDEGEKELRKAIELSPTVFGNYQTLLRLYEQKKDENAFQQLLTQTRMQFPDHAQLHVLLAGVYQKRGELEKAEESILRAINLQKHSVPLRLTLAEFYKSNQQVEKAAQALQEAIMFLPEDLQLRVALADLLFDLQKFDEARTLADGVLAHNPAHGGATLIKVRFLIKDGKDEEALDLLTPLINSHPKWADPYYFSALIHLRIGKIDTAQKAIAVALQNQPANDRHHTLDAQIHLVQGNSAEAGKAATMALRLNPRNFVAVKILAQSLVQAKDFEKAVKLIDSIDNNLIVKDPALLGSRGMAYLGLNDRDKAQQTFALLLALVPSDTRALGLLAALTAGNDIAGTIDFVKAHIAKHPGGGHYLLLGDLHSKNKNFEDALRAYEKAQELSPDNPQGYIFRAQLLHAMGKTEETIAQFNELLQNQPDSVTGLMGLATAYESLGRFAEAKTTYQHALELQPNLPAAANNLAWLIASEKDGDLGEALRLAMQAKQALPDQANIADTLGWVHFKRNSYPLAIAQFKQALEIRPEDPAIRYHLALAQYENGERMQAIALLEQVLIGSEHFKERDEATITLQRWK